MLFYVCHSHVICMTSVLRTKISLSCVPSSLFSFFSPLLHPKKILFFLSISNFQELHFWFPQLINPSYTHGRSPFTTTSVLSLPPVNFKPSLSSPSFLKSNKSPTALTSLLAHLSDSDEMAGVRNKVYLMRTIRWTRPHSPCRQHLQDRDIKI